MQIDHGAPKDRRLLDLHLAEANRRQNSGDGSIVRATAISSCSASASPRYPVRRPGGSLMPKIVLSLFGTGAAPDSPDHRGPAQHRPVIFGAPLHELIAGRRAAPRDNAPELAEMPADRCLTGERRASIDALLGRPAPPSEVACFGRTSTIQADNDSTPQRATCAVAIAAHPRPLPKTVCSHEWGDESAAHSP